MGAIQMTKVLVITEHAPYHLSSLKDALDMALIFAAVDAEVAWLFVGQSIHSLRKNQNPRILGMKDVFKSMKTLDIYDVDQLYVSQQCLEASGLTVDCLALEVKVLSSDEQSTLINSFEKVVTL